MSISEWIAVCACIVTSAATLVCTVCVAVCWIQTKRVLRERQNPGNNPPPVAMTSHDYVKPLRPWPREFTGKPRPAPAVTPVRPAQPESETMTDEGTPACENCGAATRGPVRMDLMDGQSMLIFACECGKESKIPA